MARHRQFRTYRAARHMQHGHGWVDRPLCVREIRQSWLAKEKIMSETAFTRRERALLRSSSSSSDCTRGKGLAACRVSPERATAMSTYLRQERVVERNAEVLAVQRKAKLPLLHIEEDSNCALFLIFVAVGGALRVIPVPQLAQAVVGEASVRVTERRIEINVIGDADANFHLVFSHRMQLHLPVVQTFLERLAV